MKEKIVSTITQEHEPCANNSTLTLEKLMRAKRVLLGAPILSLRYFQGFPVLILPGGKPGESIVSAGPLPSQNVKVRHDELP